MAKLEQTAINACCDCSETLQNLSLISLFSAAIRKMRQCFKTPRTLFSATFFHNFVNLTIFKSTFSQLLQSETMWKLKHSNSMKTLHTFRESSCYIDPIVEMTQSAYMDME